jgi:hypothetical protein
MAKANPITGGSMWLPAGTPAPEGWTPETGPRLTGPGGEAAMQRYRDAVKAGERPESGERAKDSAEAAPGGPARDADVVGPDREAGPDRAKEVTSDTGDETRQGGGLSMEPDDRPAGNASRDEWLAYVAEREGRPQDDPAYEGLGRNDLRDRADAWPGGDPTQVGGSK